MAASLHDLSFFCTRETQTSFRGEPDTLSLGLVGGRFETVPLPIDCSLPQSLLFSRRCPDAELPHIVDFFRCLSRIDIQLIGFTGAKAG